MKANNINNENLKQQQRAKKRFVHKGQQLSPNTFHSRDIVKKPG